MVSFLTLLNVYRITVFNFFVLFSLNESSMDFMACWLAFYKNSWEVLNKLSYGEAPL